MTRLLDFLTRLFIRDVRTWQEFVRAKAVQRRVYAGGWDAPLCDLCRSLCLERTLVVLHDDAALCCTSCAELLKATRQGVRHA